MKAVRVTFWAQSIPDFKECNNLAGIQETAD